MPGSLLRIAALLLAAASTEALALASSASPLRASRAAASSLRAAPAMQFGKRKATTPEEKLESAEERAAAADRRVERFGRRGTLSFEYFKSECGQNCVRIHENLIFFRIIQKSSEIMKC